MVGASLEAGVLGNALPAACILAAVAEQPVNGPNAGHAADLVRRYALASGGGGGTRPRGLAGEPLGFIGCHTDVLEAAAEVANVSLYAM